MNIEALCTGKGRQSKKLLMLFLFHNRNNHCAFFCLFVFNETHCFTKKGNNCSVFTSGYLFGVLFFCGGGVVGWFVFARSFIVLVQLNSPPPQEEVSSICVYEC